MYKNICAKQRLFSIGQGIVLIGGSGAGKTTLGNHLAYILGMPFLDIDKLVETNNNDVISNIFASHSEIGFRFLEANMINKCLAYPSVLALGAGAWENVVTRKVVRNSGFAILWLAESPHIAWLRVANDRSRPLVTTYDSFLSRWSQRMSAWSTELAINTMNQPPNVLANILVSNLKLI